MSDKYLRISCAKHVRKNLRKNRTVSNDLIANLNNTFFRKMDRIQHSKERLNKLLEEVDLPEFPNYLRDLLSYTAYDNYISISEMTEDDITKIEDFAKTCLPELLDATEKKDFFGIFLKKPELFRLGGDIKLLNNLQKRCLTICEKNKNRIKVSSSVSKDSLKTSDYRGQKRSPNLASCSKENKKLKVDFENEELRERKICFLKNRVTQYMNTFTNRLPQKVKEETLLLIKNVTVELKEDSALITCPKCPHKSKVYHEEDKGTLKWVTSNINRHFKTHFKTYLKSAEATTKLDLANKPQQGSIKANTEKVKCSPTLLSFFKKSNDENKTTKIISKNIEPLQEKEPILLNNVDRGSDVLDPMISGLCTDEGADSCEENFSQGSTINEETYLKINTPEQKRIYSTASITPRITPQSNRQERKLKARELRFDAHQLMMTDFYQICDKIKTKITSHPLIQDQFKSVIKEINTEINDVILINEKPETFLDMLKESVLLNVQKTGKSGNRYSDSIKKLSLYFF